MALTRTFTREELDKLGLPDDLAKERVLLDELWENRDWVNVHRLVFRSPDDDQIYEVYYNSPPTEMQEGTDPWNDDLTVDATIVEQRTVFRLEWRPAGSAQKSDEVTMGIDEAIKSGLKCARCQDVISYQDCPTGGWWIHRFRHPEDSHDAVSLMWGADAPPWIPEDAE
jgi:hypothetical protein